MFDSSALLDLYRLPPIAREDMFKALEHFKERLWIPYQVGLEVQRNRFTVINGKRKGMTAAGDNVQALLAQIEAQIAKLKLEQHEIGFEPEPFLKRLAGPVEDLSEAIEKAQEGEPHVSASDQIRDRLDRIYDGKVGPGPRTQEELDILCENADFRYQNEIPPGFADAEKKEKQKFIHDHLLYHNKYGDLILWRQSITHVKSLGLKCVMFVTSEQKEDWWWKEGQNKVIGPHQELMREMQREAGIDLFWMYRSDSFLNYSQRYTQEKVTPESVAEVTDLVQSSAHRTAGLWTSHRTPRPLWGPALVKRKRLAVEAVRRWAENVRGSSYFVQDTGFDFVSEVDGKERGYIVLSSGVSLISPWSSEVFTRQIDSLKVLLENSRFDQNAAVIVLPDGDKVFERFSQNLLDFVAQARAAGIDELVIGAIRDEFQPFAIFSNDDTEIL
ncbi:PIN-like domain-containing protein [Neorhizobium sp. DAR64861/K0K2]|uniref:PIN-like domain-containing protein n=1 Tax=unclassified Neorhizobium TaxID=2629175 RepID=UPI003D2691F0